MIIEATITQHHVFPSSILFVVMLPSLVACQDPASKDTAPSDDTAGGAHTSSDSGTPGDTGEVLATPGQVVVLESSDGGQNWIQAGLACIPGNMHPVDPAPVMRDEGLVLYFFDFQSIEFPEEGGSHCIYRTTSTWDSLDFDDPQVALCSTTATITDPMPIMTSDGTERLYFTGEGGVASATADDDGEFVLDDGIRVEGYPIPGALRLADDEIRMFGAGPEGLVSSISNDGLIFKQEEGVRMESPEGYLGNPHPIHLSTGGFLMALTISQPETLDPNQDVVVLASSHNGSDWLLSSPSPLANGSVPGLVELPDGRLLLFYAVTESTAAQAR